VKGLVRFAEALGVELYPGQREVLQGWAASGRRKAVLRLGRRSGKGLLSALAAIHNAIIPDYSAHLRQGELRFVLVVATREQQAREFIRVVRELLRAAPDPAIAALVDEGACTADEVAFRTGVVIRALPCSSRSTRGLAASLVIFDELAHFVTTDEGHQAARTVWRALVPSVAQFGAAGYVLVTSTPLWSTGLFHDLCRAGSTGADPDLYHSHRATWECNQRISRQSLAGEFAADPEGAEREYAAQFVEGIGALLPAAAVQDAVVPGRRALPPVVGRRYVAAADPAFAAGGDAFTFAIAHREGTGPSAQVVLDRLEAWRGRSGPLSSDLVLDEIADLAKLYGIRSVISDQYAVIPLADGLRRRGVHLQAQPLTNELKADIFGALKRALNLGQIELLDDAQLVAELVRLEVRPTPSGKPRIAAAGGGHDDRAMVVAEVAHALAPGRGITAEQASDLMRLQEELRAIVPTGGRYAKLGGVAAGPWPRSW
jgi:hypothetical protein